MIQFLLWAGMTLSFARHYEHGVMYCGILLIYFAVKELGGDNG